MQLSTHPRTLVLAKRQNLNFTLSMSQILRGTLVLESCLFIQVPSICNSLAPFSSCTHSNNCGFHCYGIVEQHPINPRLAAANCTICTACLVSSRRMTQLVRPGLVNMYVLFLVCQSRRPSPHTSPTSLHQLPHAPKKLRTGASTKESLSNNNPPIFFRIPPCLIPVKPNL